MKDLKALVYLTSTVVSISDIFNYIYVTDRMVKPIRQNVVYAGDTGILVLDDII